MHRFSNFWTFWKPFDPIKIQNLRGITFEFLTLAKWGHPREENISQCEENYEKYMKTIIQHEADDANWKKLIGWIVDYGFVIMYLNYDKKDLGTNRILRSFLNKYVI